MAEEYALCLEFQKVAGIAYETRRAEIVVSGKREYIYDPCTRVFYPSPRMWIGHKPFSSLLTKRWHVVRDAVTDAGGDGDAGGDASNATDGRRARGSSRA